MRCSLRTSVLAVFDDVLADDQRDRLWRFIRLASFASVNRDDWKNTFRLTDAAPLWGPAVEWRLEPADNTTADSAGAPLTYPSNSPLDDLLEAVADAASEVEEILGPRGERWSSLSAQAFLYPPAAALGWHDDARYAGSYAYYIHPRWSCEWGGELMVARTDPDRALPPEERATVVQRDGDTLMAIEKVGLNPSLDTRAHAALIDELGIGEFITPKPNRLVILRPRQYHAINRVSLSAGENIRCSIAGFMR